MISAKKHQIIIQLLDAGVISAEDALYAFGVQEPLIIAKTILENIKNLSDKKS